MTISVYPGLPPYNGSDVKDWLLRATTVINSTLNGKTNNTGDVTLNTSTSTTTVVMAKGRLGPNTVILFQPLTENAAIEVSTATMWVSTIDATNSKFMITNAVNNKNDRTFKYVLVG
jgi:hypothetical protein